MGEQPDEDEGFSQRFVFWGSLGFGLFVGLLSGLGIIFHDEKSWLEGTLAGLGFFAFGFVIMYFRYARRIAEFLSAIH